MSTSSKPKSGPPAHQNRTAFRHNKHSKKTKKIAETVTTYGLCDRCRAKQEWRVKYRKYKPLSVPRKCNKCGQKAIKAAYRTLCEGCATKLKACAGCGQVKEIDNEGAREYEEVPGQLQQREESAIEEVMSGLSERQRRTAIRRVERGEDELEVLTSLLGGDLQLGEDDSEDESVSESDEE